MTTSMQATEGVVLLHGLCRSSASMKKMAAALKEDGYQVLNHDYPSRHGTVRELSDSVMPGVLGHEKLSDCDTIHFVTHSLGGILVRDYLSRHDDPRLGRVVMLGPPNQGSEVVDRIGCWPVFRAINGPAGSELGTGPNSTPNQLGKVDFELGVIAGNCSINWINSLMIDGCDDGKVSIENTRVEGMKEQVVVPVTHPYLMKRKVSIRLTRQFLKHRTFQME